MTPEPAADPFLYDLEAVRKLASDAVVRRGLQYFKDNCVLDIGWNQERLWANVAGQAFASYQIEVNADEAGEPLFDCTCPFDAEPVCKHIVATLLSYAARQAVQPEQVVTAADRAVAERVKSAHTEVLLEHVSGDPWFGTWEARSVKSTGAALRPYRVVIRALDERLNTCTCADFASNRLGTCKHIEAVLAKLHKRSKHRKRPPAPSVAVVHLAWDAPNPPQIRVRRPLLLSAPVADELNRHFDAAGFLKGQLPEAWFALESALAGQPEVSLGEDAAEHAKRLAEDAFHQQRAAAIRAEFSRNGGQIPGIRLPLLPYQVQGAAFLAATGRALLADDMGLGKTVQAIAAAHWLIEHAGVRRVLIVAPTSNKKHWATEVRKFTAHEALVLDGPAHVRERAYASDVPFLVAHYETIRSDQALLCEKYPPDVLILDEAQRIKNWRTRTAAVVKSIPARFVFALSGTPLENRLEELYSLMQRIDGRILGPLWRFKLDFTVTDENGKELTYRNLGELRRRLATVMLRRDRRVIADQLPARTDQTLVLPMTPHQRNQHDEAVQAAGTIAQRAAKRPLTASEEKLLMAALQRARMACDAAGLVDKVTAGSPKLDEFVRLIETLCLGEGRKVVVFSQWELMTRMAADALDRLGVKYCSLHGGVAVKARPELIDRFNDDPETMVFLSTDAGATGLNLQAASAMIVLDLPWNPAILDQRIARIHRLRQRQNVLVVLMVAENSYEERVAALIAGKRGLFAAAMAQDEEAPDVVGVSKKVLALAMEALAMPPEALPDAPRDECEQEAPGTLLPEPAAEVEMDDRPPLDVPPSEEPETPREKQTEPPPHHELTGAHEAEPNVDPVLAAIEALSQRLPGRLEQVLVARGGLVAVVDAVDAEVNVVGLDIATRNRTEIAVLDARTWATLQRLGQGSPLAGAQTRWQRTDEATAPTESPLRVQARRKLAAAAVLLDSECAAESMPLLADALALVLAERAGRTDVPMGAQVATWLFAELVPGGHANQDEAGLLLQLRGLVGIDQIPPELAQAMRSRVVAAMESQR